MYVLINFSKLFLLGLIFAGSIQHNQGTPLASKSDGGVNYDALYAAIDEVDKNTTMVTSSTTAANNANLSATTLPTASGSSTIKPSVATTATTTTPKKTTTKGPTTIHTNTTKPPSTTPKSITTTVIVTKPTVTTTSPSIASAAPPNSTSVQPTLEPEEKLPESSSQSSLQKATPGSNITSTGPVGNSTDSAQSTPVPNEMPQGDQPKNEKGKSDPFEVVSENVEFSQLRLKHLSLATSDNITELRAVQEQELKANAIYKQGWDEAVGLWNKQYKSAILGNVSQDSVDATVPEEYHIALIAYSLSQLSLYSDFNLKTRQICSGTQIESYEYKTFFKFLLLALQTLGKEPKYQYGNRNLYRGVSVLFKLTPGQVIVFQQFTSSSTSLKVAESFASVALFELKGLYCGTTMSLKAHSFYKQEEEVLFSPLQMFVVEAVLDEQSYKKYILKPHSASSEASNSCGMLSESELPTTTQATQISTRKSKSLKFIKASSARKMQSGAIYILIFTVLSLELFS